MTKFGFSYSELLTRDDLKNLRDEGLEIVEVNSKTPKTFIEDAKSLSFEFTYHVSFFEGI